MSPREPCDLTIESVVPHYANWLRKVASGMLSPTHEALSDLIQEGYIAMWRGLQSLDTRKSPADYWLKRCATQRMMTVVQRNHWTGQTRRTNGGHGGSKPQERVLSLDEVSSPRTIGESYPDGLDTVDPSAEHAIETAEWAYHDGEIIRVLNSLPQKEKEYVIRRFWYGWQEPQLNSYFESHSPNIWKRVKPKLAQEFSHLSS